MFPGQNYAPHMLPGSHTENKMLRPRGNLNIDLFDESMRKRKSGAMDQPGPESELNYDYSNQFGSTLEKGTSWVPPGQNQAYNLDSEQRQALGQTNDMHHFNKDQFHFQNSYAAPLVTSNMNFVPNGNHNFRNVPSPPPPLPPPPSQSLAYRSSGPWMTNNMNFIRNSNYNLCNAPSPSPPPSLPPALLRSSAYRSSNPLLTSNMNFLPNSHHNLCNRPSSPQLPPLPPRSSAYGAFGSVNMQATVGVARPIWQPHASNAIDSIQNNRPSSSIGVNGVAIHNNSLLQNGGQSEVIGSFSVSAGGISSSEGQGNGAGSVREINKTGESNVNNLIYHLSGVSPISCIASVPVDASHQNSLSCPLRSDEKDKLDDSKAVPTAGEQLWEGSLQLSSTVTVPSVAFFKSGEKLLNTNWYKSVDVKGKVRLEAFEKYIEDLPCSHNKGLMLISLFWKEGSPEAGLKDMKEVARGYTRTNRVGFAHLSREIHLYICPRSEAIIKILTKYGFIKGMDTIEDKQHSMIGCVIWRRKSGTSSNSATKRTETKSTAPSNSSDEDSDLDDSPLAQLVQEIVAPLSASCTSTVQDVENDGKGGKTSPGKTQTEVNGTSGLSSHQATQEGSTIVSNQQVNWFAVEQRKENFSLQNPHIHSLAMLKEKRSFDDDDDLPEFNFIASCKPSLSHLSKPLVRETLNKGLSVTREIPIEQASSLQIPSFNHSEKRGGTQNQTTTQLVSNPAIDPKNNLFDDDDMPEWCPPEHQNQSSSGIIRPDSMPSKFPVSNFQYSPRGPSTSFGHFHTPQSKPLLSGPSSENGSGLNSILGPSPSFLDKPPSNQTNNQGWGPS